MENHQVSLAEDMTVPGELFALPVARRKDGSPFVVRLTPPPIEAVLRMVKGVPPAGVADGEVAGGEVPEGEAIDRIERAIQRIESEAKAMLEAGATIEPPLSFGEIVASEGHLHWSKLHFKDRGAIVARWAVLSRLGPTQVDRLGTFRDVAAGRSAGADGDGGVPAPEVAASGPAGPGEAPAVGSTPAADVVHAG